jgi:acetate---CoA ligase (ADP-forming)
LGVPAFTAPESCAAALLAMQYQQAQQRLIQQGLGRAQGERVGFLFQPFCTESDLVPSTKLASLSGSLNEFEAKKIFTSFGIPASRECIVTSCEAALQAARTMASHGVDKFVLKILSNTITHKSDVGGVAVNLAESQVGERFHHMQAAVKANTGVACEQFLLQEMVTSGIEMILGMHTDPTGSAILLGMGGVTAELLEDTVLRMWPVDKVGALEMMQSLKTWPLLNGYRGRGLADVDALADAVVAFSNMVESLGERLVTAEINPLFVLGAGQGVVAADAVMVLV